MTAIGGSAFRNRSQITAVEIPDSVTSIGYSAFYYCSGLTSITFSGTKEAWNEIEKGTQWNSYTGSYTVHCTDGDIAK